MGENIKIITCRDKSKFMIITKTEKIMVKRYGLDNKEDNKKEKKTKRA